MNEYLYDKLLILNTVYNNTIQPSKTINQSNAIKTPLLNHQLQMINYMHLYRDRMIRGFLSSNKTINGKLGILGEPSGTGKTLTVLSYIASIIEPPTKFSLELENSSNKYFFSHNLYEVNNQRSTNLIIVPHSLFTQWKNEATTHTTLKFVPLETRRFIKGDDLATNMINSSFVLTTSKCYKYVQEFATRNNIYWNNVFIDEATNIYISPSDPILKFQFLWFITNDWLPLLFKYTNINKTDLYALRERIEIHPELEEWLTNNNPINVNNHVISMAYLKEYLPYLHNQRGYLVLRNSQQFIKNSMNLPPILRQTIRCKPMINLHSIIAYFNKNSESMNDAITRNLLFIFQALNVDFISFDKYIWGQPVYKHALIKRKYEETECIICLEKAEYPTIVKCCYNFYCGKCLLKNMMISHKCPTCRDTLLPSHINCIHELSDDRKLIGKSKQELCIEHIQNNPTGKYIIYTMFDNIYYQMHSSFVEKGIIADRIENNLFSMLKSIQNFNNGNTRVLFISNPNIIKGISLQSVTHLIFFHAPSFSEMEQTLMHSAQRIGRKQSLQIIHLNSELDL